jgi:predicted DNA-binding protein with PD1-like motif
VQGLWYREVEQGRRFLVKLAPGEDLKARLVEFARAVGLTHAVVVSAVGSVQDLSFRGIKSGAKLPITPPRMHLHELAGPLELLGLTGNLMPDDHGQLDCHLHVMAARSSGEVVGGHLFAARVFATCEVVLSELKAEGVERHVSRTGGIPTVFIPDEPSR